MAKVSKAFLAKYPGKCKKCGNRFIADKEWLNYVDGVLQHVQCPTSGRPALGTSVKTASNYQSVSKPSFNVPLPIDSEEDKFPKLVEGAYDGSPEAEKKADEYFEALGQALFDVTAETPREEIKQFIPSQYQQDFFDALLSMISDKLFTHIVVEAVAGSGKSTTLIEGIKRLVAAFPSLEICVVAFNKHIEVEFSNKLTRSGISTSNAIASTKHSLGLKAVRKTYPKAKVDKYQDKLNEKLDEFFPVSKQAVNDGLITLSEKKVNYIKRNAMRRLVGISKSVLVDVQDVQAVHAMIDRYGLEIDSDIQNEVIEKLPEVIEHSKSNPEMVDFDDMGWLPIALNLEPYQFDVIMIDEAQDMSKGDMEFLFRCIKPGGHIVAVGDRFQSLYGFRGADTDAIPNIIEMLNAKVLPLSVTYRCPSSHVDLAKKIVPQLEAKENAPAGEVIDMQYFDLTAKLQAGDMVICRTNAPLVRPAFECIRMGKKAMIRGLDVGESLVNLVKRFETNDLASFEVSLAEYFEKEYTKLTNNGKDMQAALLQDRVETLQFICNESRNVADVINKIEMLFSDNNAGIVFSSVHRAKGLEADNVFILHPEKMPHPKAKKDWEQQQEQNCLYVAQTRSKNNLVFVHGGENV